MSLYLRIAGIAFILDQISKWVVCKTMVEGERISIYGDIFNLSFVKNEGIAFGLLQGKSSILILVSLAIIIMILLVFRRMEDQGIWSKLAIGLVLGGAVGNLFDRVRFGGVIDFIDIGFKDFRWPTFNLADSFILLGGAMIFYYWILFPKRRGQRI